MAQEGWCLPAAGLPVHEMEGTCRVGLPAVGAWPGPTVALLPQSLPSFSSGPESPGHTRGCSFGIFSFSMQRWTWEGGGPGVLALLPPHVGTLFREPRSSLEVS